jgi:hypothetical protein
MHSSDSDSENLNNDNRAECVQVGWVTLNIKHLDQHLATIFEQLQTNFNSAIVKCAILPANSNKRSTQHQQAGTTSVYLYTRDGQYNLLMTIIQNYRSHRHGRSTKLAHFVFCGKDTISKEVFHECQVFHRQ